MKIEIDEQTIIKIVKPYLENVACVGIRDPEIDGYIKRCAEGIAKNILDLKEKEIEENDKTYEFKCKTCGKILTDKDVVKLKIPQQISEWDKSHKDHKISFRENVHICCNRIRMIDQNTGELVDYPIPENCL